MPTRLTIDANGSEEDTRSLRNWLGNETAVRRYGQLGEVPVPGPGGTMTSLTAISLLVGSGLSLAQLAMAVVAWHTSRPKPVLLRVQVGNRSVEVRLDEVRDARSVAEQLEASLAGAQEAV